MDHTIKEGFELQANQRYQFGNSKSAERKRYLRHLDRVIWANRQAICTALYKDLGKSEGEAMISEVFVVLSELRHIKRNLSTWMLDQPIKNPIYMIGTQSRVRYESKGRVLIISPWNYPFLLSIAPLIGAIAAGNTVVLKPSEFATHTSTIMRSILAEVFDSSMVQLYEGGPDVAQELLALPFEHMYFTGSTKVGRIVMESAAKHLSGLTLELGGKSPTLVSSKAHIPKAASRIVFTKFFNNGQICVAPDYLLVHESILSEFLDQLKKEIHKLFGNIERSDYTRIVNEHHFDRLKGLLDSAQEGGAELLIGGDINRSELFMEPTVVLLKNPNHPLMEEEIFGPILPVLVYNELDEAVRLIHSLPDSLASYIYTKDSREEAYFIEQTRSGGGVVNNGLIHLANYHLAFGGTRHSGMGRSKGWYSFMEFTNHRSIVKTSPYFSIVDLLGYPFTKWKLKIISLLSKWL